MIGTILLCQILAPWEWMNIPKSYGGLSLIKIEHEPGGTHTYKGIPEIEGCEEDQTDTWPPTTNIYAKHSKGRLRISINSDTNELVGFHGDGYDYGGSGMIGVMLIGIPGTIIASPLILLSMLAHWVIRKCTGKDWQYWLIYRKLKKQLPAKIAEQLDKSLR